MATPAADPESVVRRIRDVSRSALFQASRPWLDGTTIGALMSAAGELMRVADQLEAELAGAAVPEAVASSVMTSFDVPPSRARGF